MIPQVLADSDNAYAMTVFCQLGHKPYIDSSFSYDLQYNRILQICRETSNIRRAVVGNKIVDHSDAVGASLVGAAPTISSFST